MVTRILTSAAVMIAGLNLVHPAHAQNTREESKAPPAVEITPHLSSGSASSTGVGATVRWPVGAQLSVEVETGVRRAEIDAVASTVGLLYDLPTLGAVKPYVAAGIGVEQYGFAVESPAGGPLMKASTAFTVNAGGGIRVPLDQRWGFRADARWSNGIGRDAPERWRLYNGVTFGSGRR